MMNTRQRITKERAAAYIVLTACLSATLLTMAPDAFAFATDNVGEQNLRRLDDRKYKFSWPECSIPSQELTTEACQALIEADLEYNVVPNVLVKVKSQTDHTNQIQLLVNKHNHVIGPDHDGMVSYPFLWKGHPVGPWNCAGRNDKQCCRMIQRHVGKDENGALLGCYRDTSSVKATVRKGLQDDVLYEDFLFNDESKTYELTYVEQPEAMTVVLLSGQDGKVHEVPTLKASVELNPAMGWTSYLTENQDSPLSYSSMSITGSPATPATSSVLPTHLGDTWWYSVPFIVSFVSVCVCCSLTYFMCCVPIDQFDDDDSEFDKGGLGQESKTL